MSKDKIEKGRHILRMKMASGKHLENPDWDLMKIPLEALHKVALQQIGEQEAHIEELEETVKKLQRKLEQKEEKFALTKEENRRIAEEVRREEVNARILRRFEESQQNNGKLKKKCNELSTELCMRMMEILQLKERIQELEQRNIQ